MSTTEVYKKLQDQEMLSRYSYIPWNIVPVFYNLASAIWQGVDILFIMVYQAISGDVVALQVKLQSPWAARSSDQQFESMRQNELPLPVPAPANLAVWKHAKMQVDK